MVDLAIFDAYIKNFLPEVFPLLLYVIGMVVYAVFVFKFYHFISNNSVFNLNLDKYNKSNHPIFSRFFGFIFYVIEFILFFPALAFTWFVFYAGLLIVLASNLGANDILILSMAVVASSRITSYYSEELATDISKMLPLAILGSFLVSSSSFTIHLDKIFELASLWSTALYYLGFIILVEMFMRVVQLISGGRIQKKDERS